MFPGQGGRRKHVIKGSLPAGPPCPPDSPSQDWSAGSWRGGQDIFKRPTSSEMFSKSVPVSIRRRMAAAAARPEGLLSGPPYRLPGTPAAAHE